MRKLITHDAFLAFRVLKEIDIKQELIRMAEVVRSRTTDDEDTEKIQQEVGMELIMGVLANAGTESAERAVYAFLAGPMEIPAGELAQMDLLEFMNEVKKLIEFIDKDEWRDFFTPLVKTLLK